MVGDVTYSEITYDADGSTYWDGIDMAGNQRKQMVAGLGSGGCSTSSMGA